MRPLSTPAVCFRLVAAQLLLAIGVVALAAAAVIDVTDELQAAGLLGTSLSLSSLIGLWSGLSKAAISQRVGGAVLGGLVLCAALAFALRIVDPHSPDMDWTGAAVFSMAPLMAIGIFAATLRWRGFRVGRLGPDESGSDLHGVQFSLAYLFAITSLAAILFAVIRGLRGLPSRPQPTAWEICLFAALNAVLLVLHTQVCLWAALGAGRRIARLGAVLASTAIAAGIYGFALDGGSSNYQICAEMLAIYSVLVTGSLLTLRRAGYRLLRTVQPTASLDVP